MVTLGGAWGVTPMVFFGGNIILAVITPDILTGLGKTARDLTKGTRTLGPDEIMGRLPVVMLAIPVGQGARRVGAAADATGGNGVGAWDVTRGDDSDRRVSCLTTPSSTCTSLELWLTFTFASSIRRCLSTHTRETGISRRANTSYPMSTCLAMLKVAGMNGAWGNVRRRLNNACTLKQEVT